MSTLVHVAWGDAEAVILKAVLEDSGIPVTLQAHQDEVLPDYPGAAGALGPVGVIGMPHAGGGELVVPDARAKEAREVIREYLASLRDDTTP